MKVTLMIDGRLIKAAAEAVKVNGELIDNPSRDSWCRAPGEYRARLTIVSVGGYPVADQDEAGTALADAIDTMLKIAP